MSLLRSTLFLLLISYLITWAQSSADSINTIDSDNYQIDENANKDMPGDTVTRELVGDMASLPSSCAANYLKMSVQNRKIYQDIVNKPIALCVRQNGDFVAPTLSDGAVYLYDSCGWVKTTIDMPKNVRNSGGCAFTKKKLFYSDTDGKRILQFTSDGKYEKVFATGNSITFTRLAMRNNLLYSLTKPEHFSTEPKDVFVYNINTGKVAFTFKTVVFPIALAFDKKGFLYIANSNSNGATVTKYTFKGVVVESFGPFLVKVTSGMVIDGDYNIIFTDIIRSAVYVFKKNGDPIKLITGVGNVKDVAMGLDCKSLIVAGSKSDGTTTTDCIYLL